MEMKARKDAIKKRWAISENKRREQRKIKEKNWDQGRQAIAAELLLTMGLDLSSK
jgi:hypothetical protein